jgi:hypothetical protein
VAEDSSGGWRAQTDEQRLAEEIENKRSQQLGMEREAELRKAFSRVHDLEGKMAAAEEQTAEWNLALEQLRIAFVNAAIEWLAAKWGDRHPCPYCGTDEWTVGVPVNLLLESRETLPPHFTVMCTNCGNTVFINAILAGLFPETD